MRLLPERIKQMHSDGIAPVHIVNPEELHPPERTEEAEPEHFVTLSFAVPVLSVQQILALDPARKEAIISLVGAGSAYICHSNNLANSAAAGGPGLYGAIVSAGTFTVKGSAPLWIIGAAGSALTVGIIEGRRQR